MQARLLRSPARLASASLLRVQTDERLVALARDGHEPAFDAIVERYRTPLERYAARIVGPSRAEDAVQQAFINAHRTLTGEEKKTIELRPWLYRIVHNAALNALRASRAEQPLGEDAERLALSDDVFARRERLREALDAVAALPANQRDAILLRELEGRSHEEIAVALGLSEGAARQQIFRARAALRAAASAITPAPLMAKMLEMAAGSTSGASDVAVSAGAGLTAVLAKTGAGVLVTGAVVGGAVGSGVVPTPIHHSDQQRAARAAVVDRPASSSERRDRAVLTTIEDHRGLSAGARSSAGTHGAGAHGSHHKVARHEASANPTHDGVTHKHPKVVIKRVDATHPTAAQPVSHHPETHHSEAETEHPGNHGSGHHSPAEGANEPVETVASGGATESVGGGSSEGGNKKGGGPAQTETQPATPPQQPPTTNTPAEGAIAAPQGAGGGGNGGGSGASEGTITQQSLKGGPGRG